MIQNNNNSFKQLNLELRNSRITIEAGEDDKFVLTSKREHEYSFAEDGQTLVLNQSKWRWYHHVVPVLSWRLATKTVLKVPASFKGRIVLSNRNGWAEFHKIECEKINITNRNGRVVLNEVNADDIEILAKNGKAVLQGVKAVKIKGSAKNGKTVLGDVDAEVLDWRSNNGKIMANKVEAEMADILTNNGKIVCNDFVGERLKLETNNGKIMGNDINAATVDADSQNGKIIFEKLGSYSTRLQTSNGKIRASMCGQETEYSFDIKIANGKSVIAGKKNSGSYIMKDKDKKKQITASTKNGNAFFVFLNSIAQ